MQNRILNNKYKIIRNIYDGTTSNVFYAEDLADGARPCAVKSIRNRYINRDFESNLSFKNELKALSSISHANVVQYREIIEQDDMLFLVMEYIEGISLKKWINSKREEVQRSGAHVRTAVDVMAQVCSALKCIHRAGIIHRDIKPGNIIISEIGGSDHTGAHLNTPPSGEVLVKLIDFGLARLKDFSRLDYSDPSNSSSSKTIVGTFQYMSPEQMGIMNAAVDGRSDHYSLGVVFYELLCGSLPFEDDNLASLMHSCLARTPERPSIRNPAVPEVLDLIVLRLLEKDPNRRYQSAGGLANDLDKYMAGIESFIPGLDDIYTEPNYRASFVGRARELALLALGMESALNGDGNMVLIGGEPGLGKTTLVSRFRDHVYEKGVVFIKARGSDKTKSTPYRLFFDSLVAYIRIFAAYPNDRKKGIIKAVEDASGALGRELLSADLRSPDALDSITTLSIFDKEREHQRFLVALGKFIFAISRTERGLVLFFDDLQWADEGSLALLGLMARDVSKSHLLLIGTYRDTEVPAGHGLTKLLLRARAKDNAINNIILPPFDISVMNEFISNIFRKGRDDSTILKLSEFILGKSRGNPFFAIEILKRLYDDRILYYDIDNQCGLGMAEDEPLKTAAVPETVIEILNKRISYLNDEERDILSIAALIGASFDEGLLMEMYKSDAGTSMEAIRKALNNACRYRLLEEAEGQHGGFSFIRDSIREALLNIIEKGERTRLHFKIASILEERYEKSPAGPYTANIVFEIARHYLNADDEGRALKYASMAGMEAYKRRAHDDAIAFLSRSLLLMKGGDPDGEYGSDFKNEAIEISKTLCDTYITVGRYDDAAGVLAFLFGNVTAEREKAHLYRQRCLVSYKKGDWESCEEAGRQGLMLFGERLPVKKTWAVGMAVFAFTAHIFHGLVHRSAPKRRGNHADINAKDVIWLYYILSIMYSLSDNLKFVHSVLRMLRIAESRIGRSRELGLCMGYYGLFLTAMGFYKRALHHHFLGLEMKRELRDEWGMAQSLQFIGITHYYNMDYKNAEIYLDDSMRLFERLGDIKELLSSLSLKIAILLNRADIPNAGDAVSLYGDYANKTGDHFVACFSLIYRGNLEFLLGHIERAEELLLAAYDESLEKELWFVNSVVCIEMGKIYEETGNYERLVYYYERAKNIVASQKLPKNFVANYYHLLPTALIIRYKNRVGVTNGDDNISQKGLLHELKKSCKIALRKTRNRPSRGGALHAFAQYHALKLSRDPAICFFEKTVAFLRGIDAAYWIARILYDYGVFLMEINEKRAARERLEEAYNLFKKIGNDRYLQKILEALGFKGPGQDRPVVPYIKKFKDDNKYAAIFGITSILNSTLPTEEILIETLRSAAGIAGAMRAWLIIEEGDGLFKILSSFNAGPQDKIPEIQPYSTSIVMEIFKTNRPVLATDAKIDARLFDHESVVYHGLRSIAAVPIVLDASVIGVLYFDNPASASVFGNDDLEFMSIIAAQLLHIIKSHLADRSEKANSHGLGMDAFCKRFNITNRERTIIELMLEGKSAPGICKELGVSFFTVKSHMRNIYEKTGVKGKMGLVKLIGLQ